jgi:hypothetical protein
MEDSHVIKHCICKAELSAVQTQGNCSLAESTYDDGGDDKDLHAIF